MTRYHDSQLRILSQKSTNELVSASAGSGKTTVMIQKIVNILATDLANPSQLLVITFTNLAANEMYTRLYNSLSSLAADNDSDSTRILSAIDELSISDISTINAFCYKLVKKYFFHLDLSADVSICSESYVTYLKTLALKATQSDYLSRPDELYALLDVFGQNSRDFSTLNDLVLKTSEFINNLSADDVFDHSVTSKKSADYLLTIVKEISTSLLSDISIGQYDIANVKLSDKLTLITNYARGLLQCATLSDVAIIGVTYADINFRSIGSTKGIETEYAEIKNLWRRYSEKYEKIIPKLSLIENNYTLSNSTQELLDIYMRYVETYRQHYTRLKNNNNVLDFADVEQYASKILENEELQKEISGQYKYVFVDEYQDVNNTQARIIDLLHNGTNLFVVGDVKQSIYGFRQANPAQFLQLYDKYSDSIGGVANVMNINYRSHPKILKFVNSVFSSIMTQQTGGLDYGNSSMFEPQRDDFADDTAVSIFVVPKEKSHRPTYDMLPIYSVLRHDHQSAQKPRDIMVEAIVSQITALVGSPLYDSNTRTTRSTQYKDICILLRSMTGANAKSLLDALHGSNIPVSTQKNFVINDSDAIRLIIDILKVMSYDYNDISLVAFFNNVCNISLDELLRIPVASASFYDRVLTYILTCTDELSAQLSSALDLLSSLRKDTVNYTISQTIEHILYNTGLYLSLLNLPAGAEQIEIVRQYICLLTDDENRYTISQYLSYISDVSSKSTKTTLSTGTNCVTLQTIHSSKGLEYPIVILADASSDFSTQSVRSPIIHSQEYGLGVWSYDVLARKKHYTLTRLACELSQLAKERQEELRLLYVAMTRAKNHLYIYGTMSQKAFAESSDNDYMSLILHTLYDVQYLVDAVRPAFELHFLSPVIDASEDIAETAFDPSTSMLDQILHNINHVYPYSEQTKISKKNSVTALSSVAHDEYNIHPTRLNVQESLSLSSATADMGTLYHSALEGVDYTRVIDDQLSSIDPSIDTSLLLRAHAVISPLCQGAEIVKEGKFMLNVPYNDIYTSSDITDRVLVQGIIDLLIIRQDELIVIDYKLSRADESAMVDRYTTQLKLYVLACERAYGRKVSHAYIYSILTSTLIETPI